MSRNNSNNTSSNNKQFCKVCKDAGCSESDYTSHFVKDQPGPNGKVVCPTLLNQSCRICNQTGHTSSYCKQYKPRPSREEPRHQEPRHQEPRRDDYRREEPRHQEPRHEETQRRAPYAHPHGPRVRLQLEAPALSAPAPAPAPAPLFEMPPWGTPEYWRMFQTDTSASDSQPTKRVILIDDEELSRLPITEIDVRKVDLKSEPVWDDEPLVSMDAEHRRILEDAFMKSLISDEDFDLIVAADEDNMGGRRAIDAGD